MQNGWDLAGEPGASKSSDLGGAHPTTVSCCSQEREMGEEILYLPPPPAQAPTSTSISMEHGHVQVSGASVSLEAVVSVVSS